MSRHKGVFGKYGITGYSKLSQRIKREASQPGFRVCRLCDRMTPHDLISTGSKTPYCLDCVADRNRKYHTSNYIPRRSDSSYAQLQRRNAALKPTGLFWCVDCDTEQPLSLRFGWNSQCRSCRRIWENSYLKRKRAMAKPARLPRLDLKINRFEKHLTLAVLKVFRLLGVMECRNHGWRDIIGHRCSECVQRKELKRQRRKVNQFVEAVSIAELYRRSGGVCYLCQKKVPAKQASIDHVVPLSKGGAHAYENCRLAHRMCNSIKRDTGPLVAMCDPRISG